MEENPAKKEKALLWRNVKLRLWNNDANNGADRTREGVTSGEGRACPSTRCELSQIANTVQTDYSKPPSEGRRRGEILYIICLPAGLYVCGSASDYEP